MKWFQSLGRFPAARSICTDLLSNYYSGRICFEFDEFGVRTIFRRDSPAIAECFNSSVKRVVSFLVFAWIPLFSWGWILRGTAMGHAVVYYSTCQEKDISDNQDRWSDSPKSIEIDILDSWWQWYSRGIVSTHPDAFQTNPACPSEIRSHLTLLYVFQQRRKVSSLLERVHGSDNR